MNAGEIADKLNNLTDKTKVIAVGDHSLLVCTDAGTLPVIQNGVAAMSAPAESTSHSVRLFFNRNASDLATALANTGLKVNVVGKDVLVFASTDPKDEKTIRELKRWLALIDTPRPEVALDAWSVQASGASPEEVAGLAAAVRSVVSSSNKQLRDAIDRGWAYLNEKRFDRDFPAPVFTTYVLGQSCSWKPYCLDYAEAFSERMQPSLSNMIGILAAARSPVHLDAFVDSLEGHAHSSSDDDAQKSCEDQDDALFAALPGPAFTCFRRQLTKSMQPFSLALLRAAIADYLFEYRLAILYPHEFGTYDYSVSSQQLDSQLDPLLSEFNEDMLVYLRHIRSTILSKGLRKTDFASNGIITVRTIAGNDATVNTGTQNAFPATPPPLVQDFLKNLSSAKAPDLLTSNMTANSATALAAFLNSSQPVKVLLSRDLNLDVTPITLPGASSAELAVTLEAKDDSAPSNVSDGSVQADTTDRVSNHKVTTTVRVDSLKLFEVSTFSAQLSHGKQPIPLLPPFVQLPYIGSFLSYRPKPAKSYHQSFAIVSAAILPTAADLLNGLRFSAPQTTGLSAGDVIQFHRRMLTCIANEANPGAPVAEKEHLALCSAVSGTPASR